MIGPLVAVTSRATLYPIQSIIIIGLVVSGAYFHLLDIARNPPAASVSSSSAFRTSNSFTPGESTVYARKGSDGWKWSVDPINETENVCIS
jgi:N-terminal domain with HPIH motif